MTDKELYSKFEFYLYDFADKNKKHRGKDMVKFCYEFIRRHEVK